MVDFWTIHGWFFLLGLVFFPRITVWFFSAVTGGFWFWVGFLIFPRIFIAVIACIGFWDTNPVLCVISILCCLGGEVAEKSAGRKVGRKSSS